VSCRWQLAAKLGDNSEQSCRKSANRESWPKKGAE
jgi:hypothetical protein